MYEACLNQGSHKLALEIMENLENHGKKIQKIMEFEISLNNHEKSMEFCEIIWLIHQ